MPEDKKAKELIAMRDKARAEQSNFRNLWQDTADMMYMLENKIVNTRTPGEPLTNHIFDTTAITESKNMASGLSSQIIPAGQEFFGLRASDRRLNDDSAVERYFSQITEQTHEEMFASNFMLEFNEGLRAHVVFGMMNLYSDWEFPEGLYYRNYPIGQYQVRENNKGIIDTMILTIHRTARQAVQLFGEDNLGEKVKEALAPEADSHESKFEFIQIVRPRSDRDPDMIDNLNMPWESTYVGVEDINVIEEGGYPEFPYAIPRWMKSSSEIYGRGQGTEILPQVRVLNRMMRDYIEAGNKWTNPPLQVLESFDGNVDVTPGATNYVSELPAITGLGREAMGNFPITKEILEDQRNLIRNDAFFKNTFEQLSQLTGDRRTTLEIVERLKEGGKRLNNPLNRLFTELLDSVIPRTVLLLIRNGVLPPPPPQLAGASFKVQYTGPFALAVKDQQVVAFDTLTEFTERMEVIFPGVKDNVDADQAIRDIAEFIGVKTEHIRGIRERDAIRQERQQREQQQLELEMAQAAAQGYSQTTKTPEPGSAAEQVLQEA